MALTLSEIQAVTDDAWMPGAQDNWTKGNVLYTMLMNKQEPIDSCEKVRQVLEHARARGGAFGPTTIFDTSKKSVLNAARFDWAYFWSGCTIDIEDEVKVSGGDAGIDLVLKKLDNMQTSIKDYMGDSLWMSFAAAQSEWGADAVPFYGIPDLMLQTGATKYGGIAPNDLLYPDGVTSLWKAYQNSNALTMSLGTLQTLRRGCSVNNEADGKPDLYVTTQTLWDAYEATLDAAKQHYDTNMAAAGFDNLKLGSRGVVVADDKCTASYVNAFNMRYLYFRVHKDFNFTKPVWKQPTNQPVKTTQMMVALCFLTSQRRAHGQLTAVSA